MMLAVIARQPQVISKKYRRLCLRVGIFMSLKNMTMALIIMLIYEADFLYRYYRFKFGGPARGIRLQAT